MAGITNEEINAIQKSANIVDIVSEYVTLEKKGKNYFGLCPFHDDNHPSMSVSEDKGIYTCFVCHKTGNVFNFIMDYENIPFIEAVKKVAERVGITVDAGIKTVSKYEHLYEINEYALKYYQNNLKTKDGQKAYEYLKNRHITDEIINEFGIGYSLKNLDSLTKILINKYDENELISSGIANLGSSLYDLFRNRITFPIHNANGRCVGFSSRIYEDVDEAKYVNTKETPIFKKGEILFNYHRAINEAKKQKQIILVEGQMDAIRVYSCGIKNVIATMGTALTGDHIKLLKKLNVKVVLCMDADKAGEDATLVNGSALVDAGIDTLVLRLVGAKDPDEYLIKNGVESFIDAVNHSITYFDFKINHLKQNKNFNKVDDLAKYINEVAAYLSKMNDSVLTEITVNKLAEEYKIDKNVILNKIIKVEHKESKEEIKIEKRKLTKNMKLCETLLYYMMNDTKYIELFNQELSYIPDEAYQEIAEDLLAFFIKYNYINMADFITHEINSNHYELVLKIIDNNINTEFNDNDYVGIIEHIKKWIIDEKINALKEKLKTVVDINEKLKITDEIAELKKREI